MAKVRDDYDDDEDVPRTKRRRGEEPTGWQRYKRSPVRLTLLGVLIVVMLVMAYLLYQKRQREKAQNAGGPAGHFLRAA